jgi:chromosome segregation ATPase
VGSGELRIENGKLKKDRARPDSQLSTFNSQLVSACSAVADELTATRVLIDALERDKAALKQRLEIEKQSTQLLAELDQTRKSETEALRSAITAKNEALTAKDAIIASQDRLIETLKKKKSSPWKRITDVLIGIGVGTLL